MVDLKPNISVISLDEKKYCNEKTKIVIMDLTKQYFLFPMEDQEV